VTLHLVVACLLVCSCNYDAPLTATPTRPIDERLLGKWVGTDGNDAVLIVARRLDNSTYVVADNNDLYRVFHSDFADTPFLSVQNLQPGSEDRKYTYLTWQLSADGTQLVLRSVNPKVIPEHTPPADMQKLIRDNLKNPALFNPDPLILTHAKSGVR
jgi:hypothetical protein